MARKFERYDRHDNPPPMGRTLHVQKVDGKTRFSVVILSSSFWGCFTHWNGARTVRCLPRHMKCDLCSKQLRRRWVGFVHVAALDLANQAFLELTQLAGNRLAQLVEDNPPLRGMKIHVYRERGTVKSPIAVDFLGHWDGEKELPVGQSPAPTLDRLWGVQS